MPAKDWKSSPILSALFSEEKRSEKYIIKITKCKRPQLAVTPNLFETEIKLLADYQSLFWQAANDNPSLDRLFDTDLFEKKWYVIFLTPRVLCSRPDCSIANPPMSTSLTQLFQFQVERGLWTSRSSFYTYSPNLLLPTSTKAQNSGLFLRNALFSGRKKEKMSIRNAVDHAVISRMPKWCYTTAKTATEVWKNLFFLSFKGEYCWTKSVQHDMVQA